ncbi:MAG TPA: aconitate hydratase [Candidatus Onthosoma merdavium]|uniref:aconitate hydratase n=1 Tax=Massilicoli timonensis TaxID=2015901 RepID=UPI0015B51627|nr:aconitate hydratase [Candidatus Onthosoma merdavium]
MPTLSEKILRAHAADNAFTKGKQMRLKIDQTLTQDATGTMAYLQLEAIGIKRVKTELSLSYVDHNTLQNGYENADDHKYLQSIANAYGIRFSKAGNGICHQVHLERFAKPGCTLLGSDSHTPTAGGIGALAIGAGGLDVACAMAGYPFTLTVPKIMQVVLHGKLQKGVSAKDVILTLLGMLSVKGGVGKIIEYSGDGIASLTIPERATICNMGAELGATTSIFPSDAMTKAFLESQGRGQDYVELSADDDAQYDEQIELYLDQIEPMIALPHSPDQVKAVKDRIGMKIDQVAIGSCTNSSYMDLMKTAAILKGKRVHPDVSLIISPGSRQVLQMITDSGALHTLLAAGARLLECTCGPCIGMGQSPQTDAVSLRTFNRNFYGRSGTLSAKVCLVSPETAAASAVAGVLVDPRTVSFAMPQDQTSIPIDDSMILLPDHDLSKPIIRGPNIKPLPINTTMPNHFTKQVLIKLGDHITTDHIAPAGAKVLPYRSNIEKLSEFVFQNNQKDFYLNCQKHQGGIVVAGENYGQGSSREHAALALMYLGIKAVIAKSFARIHHANLINFGILPLLFTKAEDLESIDELDELQFHDLSQLKEGQPFVVYNATKKTAYTCTHQLSAHDIAILKEGGLLNYIRSHTDA